VVPASGDVSLAAEKAFALYMDLCSSIQDTRMRCDNPNSTHDGCLLPFDI
jgi:hypothetical protein